MTTDNEDRFASVYLDGNVDGDIDGDVDEFADEVARAEVAPASPLAPPPTNAVEDFFSAGADLDALDLADIDNRPGVLDRLGPAHFRSKEFRFMGFLQTVYNHVAEQVSGTTESSEG